MQNKSEKKKTMSDLKRTALYEEHKKLSGKLVPFAGWEMPLQYGSIIDEHLNVRNKIGLFDVSHMGELFVSGTDSLALLQQLVPQDIAKLVDGKAVYSQLTNEKGGIIDDLIIYKLPDKNEKPFYLLVVNAGTREKDFNWIVSAAEKFNFDVKVENKSNDYSMIAVQGEKADSLIQEISINKEDIPERFFAKEINSAYGNIFLSRTGYTGEDGFEIIVPNENAARLWNDLIEKGQKFEVKPIGLAARDTLRLESAMHLYGQDMNDEITPVEASLGWSIAKDKEEDYFGKEIILDQLKNKTHDKVLIGFKMTEKAIPRHDYEIYINEQLAGTVTSGGIAPFINKNIGMGYISRKFPTSTGTQIQIKVRTRLCSAEIVKRPFYVRKKEV
ncbi:MAG: glycine cleavage system aminomethyltransferase GcvT [bacterium]